MRIWNFILCRKRFGFFQEAPMKKDKKSILALTGIALLILLYLTTFVTAFLDIPQWDRLFQASLAATVAVPILLWIYLMLYKRWQDKDR